ncbi:11523_t:CDS:2 [Diversispora eburnea]|uniref:11523_t:CDS:1 n=1 Tax=Diversispora eburnea TaxID=1213867 RepID=A0A9N9F9P7_9GLOM|nr:11523_t:CDS:2 [Diversispora eburnea]
MNSSSFKNKFENEIRKRTNIPIDLGIDSLFELIKPKKRNNRNNNRPPRPMYPFIIHPKNSSYAANSNKIYLSIESIDVTFNSTMANSSNINTHINVKNTIPLSENNENNIVSNYSPNRRKSGVSEDTTKFLDDITYSNKTWSNIVNIPVTEINTMEKEFLSLLDYRLYVSEQQYFEWICNMLTFVSLDYYDNNISGPQNSRYEQQYIHFQLHEILQQLLPPKLHII